MMLSKHFDEGSLCSVIDDTEVPFFVSGLLLRFFHMKILHLLKGLSFFDRIERVYGGLRVHCYFNLSALEFESFYCEARGDDVARIFFWRVILFKKESMGISNKHLEYFILCE